MIYQHVPIKVDAIQYDGTFSGAQAVSALLSANGIDGGVLISYANGSVLSLVIPYQDAKEGEEGRVVSPRQWVFVGQDKQIQIKNDPDFNEVYKAIQ